jgi:hypothetical protein
VAYSLDSQVSRLYSRRTGQLPTLEESEPNPVVAVSAGVVALDIKLKLQATEDEPDAYLRSLATRGG